MWLFTKHGFYSAVCARQGEGNRTEPVDPDRVMVRARVSSHLENLIKVRVLKPFGNSLFQRSLNEAMVTYI